VAQVAAQEIKNANVIVFDSKQLSLGTGFLVESAAIALQAGASLRETISMMEDQIQRTRVFAALDTLEYLRRSGRMNGAIAGLGSLLNIKPILKMYNGKPTSERVRTRERANQRILNLFYEHAPYEKVAIVHSNAPQNATLFYNQVLPHLPESNIPIVEITPVIGAHIGPGASGFAVVSKE
jgi:DegV family protein with EDD domain